MAENSWYEEITSLSPYVLNFRNAAEMETGRVDQRRLPVGSGYWSDRVGISWPVSDWPVRTDQNNVIKQNENMSVSNSKY